MVESMIEAKDQSVRVGKVSSLHIKCRIVLQDHFALTSVLQLGKPTEEENSVKEGNLDQWGLQLI